MLHEWLEPKTYLEIGVQTGRSMAQALPQTRCVGVDPNPLITSTEQHIIFRQTSDQFFANALCLEDPVDLAFIDGMHLIENVVRDLYNVERWSRPDGKTVVVIDDVLPYDPAIATREPLPGDWTGDVWKIMQVLAEERDDITQVLVDVEPTGALVLLNLNPRSNWGDVLGYVEDYNLTALLDAPVPTDLRVGAVSPIAALQRVSDFMKLER